jgi:hypothetical protein
MIKLTVGQLVQCIPVLQALGAQSHKGRVAFRIRKMILTLQPLAEIAIASISSLFTDENSDLLPNGLRQSKPEFTASILADPLYAEEVEANVEPLSCADLADATISPEQIGLLGPLLKEE